MKAEKNRFYDALFAVCVALWVGNEKVGLLFFPRFSLQKMFPSHSQSANVLDLRELVEGSFASQNSSDFEYSVPLSTQSASSHEALSPISPPQKEIGSSQRTMSLREPRPKHRQFRLPMRQITLAKKKFDKMKSDPNQSTGHSFSFLVFIFPFFFLFYIFFSFPEFLFLYYRTPLRSNSRDRGHSP